MRTIELKVYKFNELSDEAKAKVLERHRNWNVDYTDWYDCVYEIWQEKLAAVGFDDAKIHFSGFWSQGDGACFDAEIKALIFAKAHGYNDLECHIIEMFDPRYKIENVNSHYSHENCRDVQYQECYNGLAEMEKVLDTPKDERPLLIGTLEEAEAVSLLETILQSGSDLRPDLFMSLEKDMEKAREDLSRQIYRDLESEYESLTTDEAVIESLESNDIEFDEDGDDI